MYYTLQLQQAFLLVGLLLLIFGATAVALPNGVGKWLQSFPRSRGWGLGLLLLAGAWFFYLILTIDLGEFVKWQRTILYIIPVATILTALFVEELLAVRALGMVLLLAAEPILEAAFLRPEDSRLFLVSFAYVVIVLAMFWIGMPYLLRDQIRWLSATPGRLRGAAGVVGAYGLLLLILGLTLHRSA